MKLRSLLVILIASTAIISTVTATEDKGQAPEKKSALAALRERAAKQDSNSTPSTPSQGEQGKLDVDLFSDEQKKPTDQKDVAQEKEAETPKKEGESTGTFCSIQ